MTYLILKVVHVTEAWAAYEKLYTGWALWGLVALLAPVGALIIMVLKPPLPAF